jgi:hypothetical protein
MISNEQLEVISKLMMAVMQVSIAVPMAVVWRRQRHFSPAIKLLSTYVYLSACSALAIQFLYPLYFATNMWMVALFNLCKIVLFRAVYNQVLVSARARRVLGIVTLITLVSIVGIYWFDARLGATYGRIMQCAVLAAFALAYLEQSLNRLPTQRPVHDPLWLLSVGQLIYSAGTVTAFSQDYLFTTFYDYHLKYLVVATIGLVFNSFLTLAFLRARQPALAEEQPAVASSQFATS